MAPFDDSSILAATTPIVWPPSREQLETLLAEHNKTAVAKLLGKHRRVLDRLIVRLGLVAYAPTPKAETAARRAVAKARPRKTTPAPPPETGVEVAPSDATQPLIIRDTTPVSPSIPASPLGSDTIAAAVAAEPHPPAPKAAPVRVKPTPEQWLRYYMTRREPCEEPTGVPKDAPDVKPRGFLMTEREISRLYNGAQYSEIPFKRSQHPLQPPPDPTYFTRLARRRP